MKYEKMTFKMALQLASPHTWAASVLPALFALVFVLKARAFGEGTLQLPLWKAAALFLACVLMQSSVNTLNDYFDFKKGADSKEDNLDPSDAVLLYNNIKPGHALALGLSYLAAAAVLGIASALGSGMAPFAIGIAGGLCVLLYSGGSLPISYLPLGELLSGFVMGGLIPLGIVAVAAGHIVWSVLLYALPLIIGIGLIMMSNNGCDIEKDIEAGRKTLPSLLGRAKTKRLYGVLCVLWLLLIILLLYASSGLVPALIALAAAVLTLKPVLLQLLWSPLDQAGRIRQMKLILKANIIWNGIYILATLLAVFLNK